MKVTHITHIHTHRHTYIYISKKNKLFPFPDIYVIVLYMDYKYIFIYEVIKIFKYQNVKKIYCKTKVCIKEGNDF